MKQTVYTASPESQQIHVWRMDEQGDLTLLQVVDVPGRVQPMVISPDKAYLYVGVRPDFRLLAYRIAPDSGALTLAGEAALPGSPTHISTDHQGRFIFSASYNASCVSVTPLQAGLPGEVVAVVEGLEGCHSANISPDNRTLWVLALQQDKICLFDLHDDGQLTAQNPPALVTVNGVGPRHMVFHPNQQYGYSVNESGGSVDVWALQEPAGKSICIQSVDMMPADFTGMRWGADIHLTPDGRHLYTCDRTASIITIFSVSADGRELSVVGFQPTESQPRGFNLDNSGNYLIAAGQKSQHISVYKIIAEQGLLQEQGRYAVGEGPMWVVVNAL